MRTQMHADAMPEVDPSTLTEPAVVARRLVRLLESGSIPNGSRVLASKWEASP
jgi:hypothetical protein